MFKRLPYFTTNGLSNLRKTWQRN